MNEESEDAVYSFDSHLTSGSLLREARDSVDCSLGGEH